MSTTQPIDEDFKNIPISDVEITCRIENRDGHLGASFGIIYSEPLPLKFYGIYALRSGFPLAVVNDYQLKNAPPDCFPVFIATDQRAMWGRRCPECSGYWRASAAGLAGVTVCCYCGHRYEAHHCLSDAQRAYVSATCAYYAHLLDNGEEGEYRIRARELLERTRMEDGSPLKPEFFVEQSKQTNFSCTKCGNKNDVLGRFAYCSSCGSRNDVAMYESDVEGLRNSINNGGSLASALKDAIDGFDAIGRNFARQLCKLVPMTPARLAKWERANFAQLEDAAAQMKLDFDIDMLRGLDASERKYTTLMFHRRHLHAHKGSVADQKYIDDTGDTVAVGQWVRETPEGVHRLLSLIVKIASNLHTGFHSIITVIPEPIAHYELIQAGKRRGSSA